MSKWGGGKIKIARPRRPGNLQKRFMVKEVPGGDRVVHQRRPFWAAAQVRRKFAAQRRIAQGGLCLPEH